MTISLEERESDYAAAEARASAAAERWLESRAKGYAPADELDDTLLELRRAARRLERTQKRENLTATK